MKTIKVILLAVVISLISSLSQAQILNFDLQIKNLKLGNGTNAVFLNSFDSLQFTLLNNGTDSFVVNGGGVSTLRFYYYVDTMVQNPTQFSYQLVPTDSVDVMIPAILNPGDSVQLRTQIQFPPTIFTKFKDNEIVIWPKFQPNEASPQNNSARIFVYCYGDASVDNIDNKNKLITVFPNPFIDKTKIVVNGFNNSYQYEIFDMVGKFIIKSSIVGSNNFIIDFKNLNTTEGDYFIRIFDDKKSSVAKIVYTK